MKSYIKRLSAKAAQIKAVRVPLYGAAFVTGSLVVITLALTGRETVPDFRAFEVGDERKEAFFSFFLPLIDERNKELMVLREELQLLSDNRIQLSFFERRQVADLADIYEIDEFSLDSPTDWNMLLRRVDVVPPSLALAQAANESDE
jgi:Bax protein